VAGFVPTKASDRNNVTKAFFMACLSTGGIENRALVPAQLRRRGVTVLEPLILDPGFERDLVQAWGPQAAPDPADALTVREQVEAFLSGRPSNPALVCTGALRASARRFLGKVRPADRRVRIRRTSAGSAVATGGDGE
jgi:hypothetical protein